MPSYLKPLVRLRNIWRRVYSRPHTGTCRRQIASARTRTALRPPHGFCPVKRRIKESNYCSRLKGSFRYAQPALVKLNNYCIVREALSIGTDYFAMRDQKMHSCYQNMPVLAMVKTIFEGVLRVGTYSDVLMANLPQWKQLFCPVASARLNGLSSCIIWMQSSVHARIYIYNLTYTLTIVPGHNCLAHEAKCTLKAQISWRV